MIANGSSERFRSVDGVRCDRVRAHCNANIEMLKAAEPMSDGARHLVKIKIEIYEKIITVLDGETP